MVEVRTPHSAICTLHSALLRNTPQQHSPAALVSRRGQCSEARAPSPRHRAASQREQREAFLPQTRRCSSRPCARARVTCHPCTAPPPPDRARAFWFPGRRTRTHGDFDGGGGRGDGSGGREGGGRGGGGCALRILQRRAEGVNAALRRLVIASAHLRQVSVNYSDWPAAAARRSPQMRYAGHCQLN